MSDLRGMKMPEGSAKAARQPQVVEQMERVDSYVTALEQLTDTLMQRLDKALRQDAPLPDKGESTVAENVVILASHIREVGYRISGINGRVEDILDRLEL